MADKITYSLSVTPIETVTQAVTYSNIEDAANHATVTNNSHDVLATEVGTSLGGTGQAVCNGYAATAAYQGYFNQTVNYRLADDANDSTDISAEASASFVFIKNTGKVLATDNTAVLLPSNNCSPDDDTCTLSPELSPMYEVAANLP